MRSRERHATLEGMDLAPGVQVDDDALQEFCRAHGIQRLALFGSALGDDFGSSSDIDLLVEFETGRVPGLLHLAAIELDLEKLIGREVELRTTADLSPHVRDEVATNARLLYAAA